MKAKHQILLTGSLILFMVLVLPPIWRFEKKTKSEKQTETAARNSITFVLGEDNGDKTYFADAAEYFQTDSIDKTNEIISSCRTLSCVIETLNALENDTLWGTINIVAHGNPQTGLNLYLSKDGHKATPKRMVQETILRNLPSMDTGKVDSMTRINVWSCGVGKSPMINFAFPLIFADSLGNRPDVYCSPYFIIFEADKQGIMRKINASYWPFYFKRGYRPSPSEIAAAMEEEFPEVDKDWEEKLDDSRTMDYHIPVSFKKYYQNKEDRPELGTFEDKMAYLDGNKEILEMIESSGIPREQFKWTVEKRFEKDIDGELRYFVKVLGMSTVMCFLETI